MNRKIGHELGQSIKFNGDIPKKALAEDPQQILRDAHIHSFPLKRSSLEIAISDIEMSKWVHSNLPKVNFEVRTGHLPLGERSTDKSRSDDLATYYLLTARLDIFSGLSSIYERKSAIARKMQSEEALNSASIDLLSSVEKHLRLLASLERRINIESTNAIKTEKFKDIVSREYRSGVKSIGDFSSAVDMLIESRQKTLAAILQWHRERFALEHQIGRRLVTKEVL
jgi:outer membrane protein TolC